MILIPKIKKLHIKREIAIYKIALVEDNRVTNKPERTVPMKNCCKEIRKEMEKVIAQKQKCGCPSLHPYLRSHTYAFFANPPAMCKDFSILTGNLILL